MLTTTELAGFGGAVLPDAVLAYQTAAGDTTDASTYTFSAQAIGPAANDRYVIVGIDEASVSSLTVTSVTIGGITATFLAGLENTAAGVFIRQAFYIALVPTGTTATIVVTLSGTAARCGIGVWSVTSLANPTPTDSFTSTAANGTGTLTIPPGGIGIAGIASFTSASPRTYTWSGLTENYDAAFDANNHSHSGASLASTPGVSGTVTATASAGPTGSAMAAVALR